MERGGEFAIVEDDRSVPGGLRGAGRGRHTSKADGAAAERRWSRARGPTSRGPSCGATTTGTFRSNQLADNAYPSKVFPARLADVPFFESGLWPPSCEVALGFAYMMYGADLGTLQVTVTGCWTYDCADENDYTEVELWSVSGNNPARIWEEAVVHLPPGTSYVSFVATTGSGALSDFALDSIRMFDFHPASAPTVTPHPSRSPTGVPVRAAHLGADDLHPAVAGAVRQPRATTPYVGRAAPSISPRPSPEPSPRPTAAPTSLKSGSKSSSSNDATLYIIIIA